MFDPALFRTPRGWAIVAGILALVLMTNACHEGGHALAAWWAGDRRRSVRRRVTLNPIRHFHWFLTLVLPVLSLYFLGWLFGGARPVLIDAGRIGPRRMALVALAGPAGNFLFAGFLSSLLGLAIARGWIDRFDPIASAAWKIVHPVIWFSVFLGLLNLIPIPPLDGSRVLGMLLPDRARMVFYMLAPLGLVGVVLLLLWLSGELGDRVPHPRLFWGIGTWVERAIFEMRDFWSRVV